MPVDISIIIPVFDEEANILPLAREVAKALDKEPRDVMSDALRATRDQGGLLRVFCGHSR